MNAEMTLPEMPPAKRATQYEMVERVMRTGFWWTYIGIRAAIHGKASEASISARLRQMRSKGWIVDRRPSGKKGIFEYRCTKP